MDDSDLFRWEECYDGSSDDAPDHPPTDGTEGRYGYQRQGYKLVWDGRWYLPGFIRAVATVIVFILFHGTIVPIFQLATILGFVVNHIHLGGEAYIV